MSKKLALDPDHLSCFTGESSGPGCAPTKEDMIRFFKEMEKPQKYKKPPPIIIEFKVEDGKRYYKYGRDKEWFFLEEATDEN